MPPQHGAGHVVTGAGAAVSGRLGDGVSAGLDHGVGAGLGRAVGAHVLEEETAKPNPLPPPP